MPVQHDAEPGPEWTDEPPEGFTDDDTSTEWVGGEEWAEPEEVPGA